jgi:TolA-binding protein
MAGRIRHSLRPTYLTITFAAIAIAGCAYFNAFYNARKNFNEAEKQYRESQKNAGSQGGSPQTQKYNSAIESAARLLQNYPNSKWVDDALLLMGKSYYRIQQYNRANRKFDELFANHPESPLVPEGKYWWALNAKEMGNLDDAVKELRSLLGVEIPRGLETDVRFGLADMLFEQESYHKARVEYKKIVEKFKDNRHKSRAQYRIAECYQVENKDSLAAQAFLDVMDYNPDRSTAFETQFNYGIVLKNIRRFDEAQSVFESLLEKDIYFEYFPRVELELADLLYRTGTVDEAKTKYQRLVEVHPRSETSARAYYELGIISLNHDRNIDLAKEYFGKVRGESSQSEFVPLAQAETNSIDDYLSISTKRAQIAGQLVSLEEVLAALREGGEEKDSIQEAQPEVEGDSASIKSQIEELYHKLDTQDFRLAEYYLYDLKDLDSTLHYLSFLIKPGVSDTIRAKSLITMASIFADSLTNQEMADSLRQVLVTEFPGTDYQNYALQKLGRTQKMTQQDSLEMMFNQADSLLWDAGDTLVALNAFQSLAMMDTTSLLAAQSQYTAGWIFEFMIGNKDSALIAYQKLVNLFPNTGLAQNVKARIEATVEPIATPDSLIIEPTTADSGEVAPEIEAPPEKPVEGLPIEEELETKRRIIKR